jgi:PEGA domain
MRRPALLLASALACISLSAVLASCAPAALRSQPGAGVSVQTSFNAPVVQSGVYRRPGPSVLLAEAPAASYVSPILLQGGGGALLLSSQSNRFGLPMLSGFTQLFTVVSLEPLNLNTAALAQARSLSAVGEVVAAATKALPAGSWNVKTDVFRVSDFGRLVVQSFPSGADVTLNGQQVGTTPLRLDTVEAGSARVSVSQTGYGAQNRTVTVVPNQTSVVRVGLALLPTTTGLISVSSSVPASVSIDGQTFGPAPVSATLQAGTHTVSVSSVSGSQSLTVQLRPSATLSVSCQLTDGALRCSL